MEAPGTPILDWLVAVAFAAGERPTALRVAIALARRNDGYETGGKFWPTPDTFGPDVGLKARQAWDGLRWLRETGFVKVIRQYNAPSLLHLDVPTEVRAVRNSRKRTPKGEMRTVGERNADGGSNEMRTVCELSDTGSDTGSDTVPHVADAPWFAGETESDESDAFDAMPDDVIATLANATAPVQLTPSSPSPTAETPQVPPPPLSPAPQPAPVATVTHPALPALSAPAVATDAPAVERKPAKVPRKRKPAVEGAEDTARAVTDAWDAAWAVTFRRPWQRCDDTCGNVSKSKCKSHFPGYAWGKGEIHMARMALKGAWTAPRLVRLMGLYHRELDGKSIPRTFGAFLRAASTIEARNPAAPAPVALTPATNETAPAPTQPARQEDAPVRDPEPPRETLAAIRARLGAPPLCSPRW